MKQTLAGVLTGLQGLGDDSARERPINRLAAMGLSQIGANHAMAERGESTARMAVLCALGTDLVAFKFANRAASKLDAEDALIAIMAWKTWGSKVERKHRPIIARQALMEWAVDFCPSCQSAGSVPDRKGLEGTQPMKPCGDCGGTGKRRYSDSERLAAMGAAHEKGMDIAHRIISWAESLAVRRARELLERW